jgi:hypothetical protein
MSQFSAYWRIGDEPMKAMTSISMPSFWEMSTTAWTSALWVRAAQAGLTASLLSRMNAQGGAVLDRALPGAGQPDVDVVDAQVVGELDEADLVLDGRVDHRGRLDAVAQGLVEEGEPPPRRQRRDLLHGVPVVDQLGLTEITVLGHRCSSGSPGLVADPP